jgi:hypothetical protein
MEVGDRYLVDTINFNNTTPVVTNVARDRSLEMARSLTDTSYFRIERARYLCRVRRFGGIVPEFGRRHIAIEARAIGYDIYPHTNSIDRVVPNLFPAYRLDHGKN